MKIKLQVIPCGRGFGKSMLAGIGGLFFADEYSTKIKQPLNVIIVSSQDALYSNIAEDFRWRPELKTRLITVPANLNEIPLKGIQFKDNYSKLIPRMATIHSVEGSRADVLILDECQDIGEEVFLKAIGCSKEDLIGKIILLGTPYTEQKGKGGKPNWFIDLCSDPKNYIKGYKFHLNRYPSDICDWNPHAMWKAAWSNTRYDAECLGLVTPKEERSTFPASNINKCCFDIDGTLEGGSTAAGETNSVLEAGIDCGYHNTVYVLLEWRGETKIKTIFIKVWKDKSIEDIASEIAKLLNSHNPRITKIDSKQGANVPSYKKEICKYTHKTLTSIDASLKDTHMVDGEERIDEVKKIMIGQTDRHFREGHYIIAMRILWAKELVEQAKKYNPKRGKNDDILDAFMLASYRPNKPIETNKIVIGFAEDKRRAYGWWRDVRNW
jgi:hypothetical protein